jgi:hypothetical protein
LGHECSGRMAAGRLPDGRRGGKPGARARVHGMISVIDKVAERNAESGGRRWSWASPIGVSMRPVLPSMERQPFLPVVLDRQGVHRTEIGFPLRRFRVEGRANQTPAITPVSARFAEVILVIGKSPAGGGNPRVRLDRRPPSNRPSARLKDDHLGFRMLADALERRPRPSLGGRCPEIRVL